MPAAEPPSRAFSSFRAKVIADWSPMLASNAVHLARLLKQNNYPGV
jgi:hypothetical protein